jgi:hypothetical protein
MINPIGPIPQPAPKPQYKPPPPPNSSSSTIKTISRSIILSGKWRDSVSPHRSTPDIFGPCVGAPTERRRMVQPALLYRHFPQRSDPMGARLEAGAGRSRRERVPVERHWANVVAHSRKTRYSEQRFHRLGRRRSLKPDSSIHLTRRIVLASPAPSQRLRQNPSGSVGVRLL